MATFKTRQQEAFEELQITRDELNQIGEAFKKEEFRKLFTEYIDEITDPENEKKFESELIELERERGNDVTFIHPKPGYVIKTSADGQKKSFINVCCNDNIGKPSAIPEGSGLQWSIPYTQAPPREDLDKKKNMCLVFDVVFHPDTIQMAIENNKFKEMVTDTALNAVESSYKVSLDKQNIRYPKIDFKGIKKPTIIRRKSKKPALSSEESLFEIPNYPYPPISEDHNVNEMKVNVPTKQINDYTTPKFIIKQRKHIDMQECTNSMTSKMNSAIPHELVVLIELPLIKSASDVSLDVTEKSLKLISEKPAKYKLDITLPYSVNDSEGSAKFDSCAKKLIVTLVVKCHKPIQHIFEVAREDSGVDSDIGSFTRSTESSSEDELIKVQPEKTEKTSSETFLSSEKYYSLPQYDMNVLGNTIAFTLHVKNVEPDSVKSKQVNQNSGFHLTFTSIGSGFFPISYSLCVKFPNGVSIDSENLDVEVWDNNVVAQVSILACDNEVYEYFSGVDEESLQKNTLSNPLKLLKAIQSQTESSSDNRAKIEVLKFEEDNVVFEISNEIPSSKLTEDENASNGVANKISSKVELPEEEDDDDKKEIVVTSTEVVEHQSTVSKVVDDGDKKLTVDKKVVAFAVDKEHEDGKPSRSSKSSNGRADVKKSARSLARTVSESQPEKMEGPKSFRGILKVGRSLSESSVDDYPWPPSSTDGSDPNGVNVEKTKKTVRFNDLILKKLYRSNSSILGQKKKNQRKARSKKRAQQRRTSESEHSEGETEDRRNSETEGSQSDISQSDVSQSDVSESDDGLQPSNKPDVMSLSKRHPHKRGGKKSARKSANTAKMAFTNNLMSDLDM